ncbi:Kelch-like protein 30 [Orchesella cincta]|uniref:Kelch-like protein 30 n=1 Tax=Orchesella cincta TaxID=48709 RepID=A0A1D2NIT8_ORCCI|nr:Kelch-like protein 30 [Orchesella cincta]
MIECRRKRLQTQTDFKGIFLAEDWQDSSIGFGAQKNKNRASFNRTTLYNGDPGYLKHHPGETYDVKCLSSVLNVFEANFRLLQLNQRNACFVEFWITYNTFYDTFRFHIALLLGTEFRSKLLGVMAVPNMCVKGKLTVTHLERRPVEEKMEYEFCVPRMNLKESRKTYLIADIPSLVELCNNATQGIVLRLDYSITLEWKQSWFEMPQKDVNVLRKLLQEKLFADCVIVASNKAEVSCHRSVLSAQSDVFHAMLTGGFQESHTGRIEMTDLSEKGVTSLMSYLYENKLDFERITEEIAFELLNCAHKYNISSLAKIMTRMLTNMPDYWFTLGIVLELYFFTVNVWEYQTLCDKMLDILRRNSKELQNSPAYQELEKTNPKEVLTLAFRLLDR